MKKIFLLLIIFFVFLINTFAENTSPYKIEYWIANVKGGVSYPVGEFANYVNPSFDVSATIRKGLDMELSVGGSFTYAVLPYKQPDAPTNFTATIINVEVAYTPYMPDFFLWPYAKAGLGIFLLKYSKLISKDESKAEQDTSIGIILGGGVIYPIGNIFAANLEVLYNYTSQAGGTGDVNTFLTLNAGIMMYIK